MSNTILSRYIINHSDKEVIFHLTLPYGTKNNKLSLTGLGLADFDIKSPFKGNLLIASIEHIEHFEGVYRLIASDSIRGGIITLNRKEFEMEEIKL